MSSSGTVNDNITDSVSQLNTLLVGGAVPHSVAMLDVTGADTLGMSMHNAVSTQQNAQISSTASVTAACTRMLQAQQVTESETVATQKTAPPFMPLDSGKVSPDDLIEKAEILAKAAVEMKQGEKKATASDADLKKLIATLSSYVSGSDTKETTDEKGTVDKK